MELLIVIAIVVMLAAIVLVGVGKVKRYESETDKEFCERRGRYDTVEDLPAICLKYFTDGKSTGQ